MPANLRKFFVPLQGLILTGTALTVLFSVATVFSGFHRYLELFSHFKVQYLAISIILCFVLLLLRYFKILLVMTIVAALNASFVLPWYVDRDNDVLGVTKTLKLMHSNVQTSNTEYHKLIDLVRNENPDILILQETSEQWLENLNDLNAVYPYVKTNPRDDNFGIALFSKLPFETVEETRWGPSDLPSLHAKVRVSDQIVSIITTHPLPPTGADYYWSRNLQLIDVADAVRLIDDPIILIGDLNITMWSGDYHQLETDTGLVNARNGFGILPTWPTFLPVAKIPIDHCLVSAKFKVEHIEVGQDIGSDHLPLIVHLGLIKE